MTHNSWTCCIQRLGYLDSTSRWATLISIQTVVICYNQAAENISVGGTLEAFWFCFVHNLVYILVPGDICSHFMAYELYAQTISNKEEFIAVKCDGWAQFMNDDCDNNFTNMGEYANASR